jgi:hypothetical protein
MYVADPVSPDEVYRAKSEAIFFTEPCQRKITEDLP